MYYLFSSASSELYRRQVLETCAFPDDHVFRHRYSQRLVPKEIHDTPELLLHQKCIIVYAYKSDADLDFQFLPLRHGRIIESNFESGFLYIDIRVGRFVDYAKQTHPNQLQKWKDVLEGKAHGLEHGYYCVRLPDETERNKQLPRSESERLADGFFRTRSPWNQMTDRSRFGIPNLVKDISALLVKWIEEKCEPILTDSLQCSHSLPISSLPTLRKQLDELIDKCNNELSALPPPSTTDPSTEMLQRIGALGRAFRDAVNATENKVLVRLARERYRQFKDDILRTSPDFRPFITFDEYRRPDVPVGVVDKPDSYRTPPMDLEYVRQVIKECAFWIYYERLKSYFAT